MCLVKEIYFQLKDFELEVFIISEAFILVVKVDIYLTGTKVKFFVLQVGMDSNLSANGKEVHHSKPTLTGHNQM